MQIIWRYLIGQYLKVFSLCVVAFVTFLLVMRMKETAEFAALGAPLHQMLLFVFYQFPFILPIAIPISCLISSVLLMQRLSRSHELVALLSAGFSFKQIITPLLTAGICLSILNFYIISEVSTHALLTSKKMVQNLSSFNPLLLLQNSQFLKFKDMDVEIDPFENPQEAKNVFIFLKERKNNRIAMYYAQSLEVSGDKIRGRNSSFISNVSGEEDTGFDNLVIDSQKETLTPVTEFIQLLKDTRLRIPYDHLQMPLLLIQRENIQNELTSASSPSALNRLRTLENKCNFEVMRRIALGIAPLSFSLLGTAFGIKLGRKRSHKNLYIILGFAALSCASFFLAKSSDNNLKASAIMLFVPQVLIILASIWNFNRCSRGIE